MLIEDHDLEVFTPPYEPSMARFAVKTHHKVVISDNSNVVSRIN